MIRVRPAEILDAAPLVPLRAALWPSLSAAEHAAERAAVFAGTAAEPEAVLVAVRDDPSVAMGFAELSRRAYAEGCGTSPVGYLEGWYVAPSWRRQGIGRALVEASEDWARQ